MSHDDSTTGGVDDSLTSLHNKLAAVNNSTTSSITRGGGNTTTTNVNNNQSSSQLPNASPIGKNAMGGDTSSYDTAMRLEALQMRRVLAEQSLQLKMALASAEASRKAATEMEQLLHEREEDLDYIASEFRRRVVGFESSLQEKDKDIEKLVSEVKLLETLRSENDNVIALMQSMIDAKEERMMNPHHRNNHGNGATNILITRDDEYDRLQRALQDMSVEREILLSEVDRLTTLVNEKAASPAGSVSQQQKGNSHNNNNNKQHKDAAALVPIDPSVTIAALESRIAHLTVQNEGLTQSLALQKLEWETQLSVTRKQSETNMLQCQQKYTQEIERVMEELDTMHREKCVLDDTLRSLKESNRRDTDRLLGERKALEEQLTEETRKKVARDTELQTKVSALTSDQQEKTEKLENVQRELANANIEKERLAASVTKLRQEEESLRIALRETEDSQQQMLRDNTDLTERLRVLNTELQRVKTSSKILEEENNALKSELHRSTEVQGDVRRVQDSLLTQHKQREENAKTRQAELGRAQEEILRLEASLAALRQELMNCKSRCEDAENSKVAAEEANAALLRAYEESRARNSNAIRELGDQLSREKDKVRTLERDVSVKSQELESQKQRAASLEGSERSPSTDHTVIQLRTELSGARDKVAAVERTMTNVRARLLELLSTKQLETLDDVSLSGLSTTDLITELQHRVLEISSQLDSYIQFAEGIRTERNSLATLLLDDADIADLGSDVSAPEDDDDDNEPQGDQEEQRRWVRAKLHLHLIIRSLKSKRKEMQRLRSALTEARRAAKESQELLMEKEHQLELRADSRIRFLVEQRPHMLREIVTTYENNIGSLKICKTILSTVKSLRATPQPPLSALDGLVTDSTNIQKSIEVAVQKLQVLITNCFTEGEKSSAGVSASLLGTPDSAREPSSARSVSSRKST